MAASTKVLLIDDDSEAVLSLARLIKAKSPNYTIEATAKIDSVDTVSKKFDPDVVILDLTLVQSEGSSSGLKVLSRLVGTLPFCRIIVLTGEASIENGVKALERGAAHFLAKPAEIHHLLILIEDAANLAKLKRAYIEALPQEDGLAKSLVGLSPAIEQLRQDVRAAADTDQNVIITGETGTGKGVCARALHQLSRRKQQPFVRYQPSFASGDLVLSELFGHKKGAFTGAAEDRPGLIKRAEGGTLFLDEIDELPLAVQVALLGVIQESKFRPLGSDSEQLCNVRFIAATNRPVEESFQNGKIRKDLYYRLAQRQIAITPLRERKEDIIPIAAAILQNLAEHQINSSLTLETLAATLLTQYSFTGNVRELEAVVSDGAHRAQSRNDCVIRADDLRLSPTTIPSFSNTKGSVHTSESFHMQIARAKQDLVREAMKKCNNNQVQAAKLLELDRTSFRRILAEIEPR